MKKEIDEIKEEKSKRSDKMIVFYFKLFRNGSLYQKLRNIKVRTGLSYDEIIATTLYHINSDQFCEYIKACEDKEEKMYKYIKRKEKEAKYTTRNLLKNA